MHLHSQERYLQVQELTEQALVIHKMDGVVLRLVYRPQFGSPLLRLHPDVYRFSLHSSLSLMILSWLFGKWEIVQTSARSLNWQRTMMEDLYSHLSLSSCLV